MLKRGHSLLIGFRYGTEQIIAMTDYDLMLDSKILTKENIGSI